MKIVEEVNNMKKDIKEVKKESFALELLKDYKKMNKRLFITIVIILCFWFATIGMFVYYINTTGFEEERTQEIEEIDDLSNSNIINGDVYGKDKAN